MKPAYYFVADPGKSTGVATFDDRGNLVETTTLLLTELWPALEAVAPTILIVEEYRLRPWMAKQQSWSTFPATEVIGVLKVYASTKGLDIVMQEPANKEMGYKYSGLPKAKSHKDSHDKDAYAHGVYYMVKNEIRSPAAYLRRR